MFENDNDAAQFVQKFTKWMEEKWNAEEEWTLKDVTKMCTDDLQNGWNGEWTIGAKEVLEAWRVAKCVFPKLRILDVEMKSWTANEVHFKLYELKETFDRKEIFVIKDMMVELKDGKVCRMSHVAVKKYIDQFDGTVKSFMMQQAGGRIELEH